MMLIDTHTHLYLEDFDADRAEMVQRALDHEVRYMLLPHIDSHTTAAMLRMARQFSESCFPMMGLHPTSVKENYAEELALAEKELATGKYCAVGEVGIDLYWDTTFQKEQEEVFRKEIELADQYHLPLVIHTRNSLEVAMDIVRDTSEHLPGRQSDQLMTPLKKGVFHCYPGTVEQAWQIIEMGYFLGIGGVVTYKNSMMAKVAEAIPLEHLLLETDAPFLTPHPHRGKRNESSYIPLIARKIAELKGIPAETVAEVTTANAVQLFRLE
ncbi:MAG: TatD family hydrolase [Bacteroidales bacterium]